MGRLAGRAALRLLIGACGCCAVATAVDGTDAAAQSERLVTPVTIEPRRPAAPDASSIEAHELERWADGWFRSRLGDGTAGAPGAAVAIVQGDRVLLSKGYGVADLATRARATDETVFRVGSLSKPFTATAIMQLVESGRLKLDAPVNRYLHDMQVPSAFGRPVTILDLATHTAGFDVRLEGTAAATDQEVQPLGTYLRANLPPQVRPPGQMLSYSNHGYALLGHVVEQVTGQAFEGYMADRLFAPLGMRRSSFRLSRNVERIAATGYEPSASGFRPSAPVHPRIYPAAGLNTTARDMTRFLIAHLNGGAAGDARILSEASVEGMQRQAFAQSSDVPGVALGFFENVTRGEPALVHAGGIRGFMSGLCLWPRYRLGLFVANNGYSGALVQAFVAAFVERYFPRAAVAARRYAAESVPDLEAFEGAYRAASMTRGSYEKAAALFGGDVVIRAAGGYRPHLDFGGDPFVRTGRLEFRLDRGDEPLAFRQDGRRRVSLLVTDNPLLGCEVFEKLPWYETARWHRELLTLFCAAFLSVVLAPLGRPLRRLAAPRLGSLIADWTPGPSAPKGTWARVLLYLVAGLDLLFLLLLVVAYRLARDTGVLYGIPRLARFDLALSAGAALLALALPVCAWQAWRRGYWSTAGRVHYTACAAAAVAFVPFLRYWNLLGY